MRSLPRTWIGTPRGDFECLCDICGVPWQRTKLVRKADGMLWCADCRSPSCRDSVTLARLNAENKRGPKPMRRDGGNFESRGPYEPSTQQDTRVFSEEFSEEFG